MIKVKKLTFPFLLQYFLKEKETLMQVLGKLEKSLVSLLEFPWHFLFSQTKPTGHR